MTIYYVSNAGNDSNNGTSEGSSFASVAKGVSMLGHGVSDTLLFKKGDVWTVGLGRVHWVGESKANPIVISSYGTGTTRPLFKCDQAMYSDGGGEGGVYPSQNYITIKGLEFYSTKRDPNHADYDVNAGAKEGIKLLRGLIDFILEDCVIRYYGYGLVISNADYIGTSGVIVRNNIIIDSYSRQGGGFDEGHSSGFFLSNTDDISITGNLFDHNGWTTEVPEANSTVFKHNVYLQTGSTNVVFDNNIICRAASIGAQYRMSGHLHGNICIRNPIGLSIGGGNNPEPGGITGTAIGNLLLHGTDMPSGEERGWGVSFDNIQNFTFQDGIAAHVLTNASGAWGIPKTVTNVSFPNRKVYKWNTSTAEDDAFGFADPEKQIEDFDTFAGGNGTFDNFINVLRNQSYDDFNSAYSGQAIKDYFNAAFATGAGSAPVIGTLSLPDGEVGKAYYYKIPTSGETPTSYAYATGADANGITLNTSTGEFTGTPVTSADITGISVTASNANGTSAPSNTDSITISEAQLNPPIIGVLAFPSASVSQAFSYQIPVTGGVPTIYSYVTGADANGITLNINTGEFSGFPISATDITGISVNASNADGTSAASNVDSIIVAEGQLPVDDAWTFFDPSDDCTYVRENGLGQVSIPYGDYGYWAGDPNKVRNAPRLRQINLDINSDFDIRVKLNTSLLGGYIEHGFLLEESKDKALLFNVRNTDGVNAVGTLIALVDNWNYTSYHARDSLPLEQQQHLRILKTGSQFDFYLSIDGVAWTIERSLQLPDLVPAYITIYCVARDIAKKHLIDWFQVENAGTTGLVSDTFSSAEKVLGTRLQGSGTVFMGLSNKVFSSPGSLPTIPKIGTRIFHGLDTLLIALAPDTYLAEPPPLPVVIDQTYAVDGGVANIPAPGLLEGATYGTIYTLGIVQDSADANVVLEGNYGAFSVTHNNPEVLPDTITFTFNITDTVGVSNTGLCTVDMASVSNSIKKLKVDGVTVDQLFVDGIETGELQVNGTVVFRVDVAEPPPVDEVAQIASFSPPNGTTGAAYSYDSSVVFSGTVNSYAINGTTPGGLNFDTGTGILSGTPTTEFNYTGISVTATGPNNAIQTPDAAINIRAAGTGDFSLLQAIVDGMAPGDWHEIPNTVIPLLTVEEHNAIVAEFGGDTFWPSSTSTSVIKAWNGAASSENKWWFWGGGHADYGGNEIYEFDLELLSWTRLNDPAPLIGEVINDTATYPAFHAPLRLAGPGAMHTYDAIAYNPASNSLWIFKSTTVYCQNGYGYGSYPEPLFWEYDLTGGSWSEHAKGISGGYALTCWDPIEQKMVLFPRSYNETGPLFIDENANITKRGTSGKGVEWGNGVYDPINRAMVNIEATWKITAADLTSDPLGSPVALADVPQDIKDLSPSREFGAAYDESNSVISYYGSGSEIATYNTASREMRMYLNENSPVQPTNSSVAVFSKFRYVDAVNAYLLYNDETKGVYVYKLGGGSSIIDASTIRAKIGSVGYTSVNAAATAAVDGDTIDIQPGDWREGMKVSAPNVTINGHNNSSLSGTMENKGVIIVNADGCTIINIELKGAYSASSGNASGIRIEPAGNYCLIQNCYIHDCQDGILTSNTAGNMLTVEDTVFDHMCEFVNEEGQQHCIYIGIIDTFIATRCTFHNTLTQGHNFKCRARVTTVTDCELYTGTGRDSRTVDLPHGGDVTFTNCIIGTNDNTVNPDMIGFGQEISTPYHPVNSWRFVDCTLITDDTSDPADHFTNDICFRLKVTSPVLPDAVAENCTIVGTFRTDLPEFQIGDINDNCYFATRADAGLPPAPDMSFTKPTCTAFP